MNYSKLAWAFLLALQGASCGAQNSRTSISNHNGETEIQIENSTEDLNLSYKGEAQFNDEETAFTALTPGSKLRFRNGREKLEVSADASGKLQYSCNGTTATDAVSPACAELVKEAIAVLIRSGAGAKERTARLYAKGGYAAVVGAAGRIPSDYVRSIYYKTVMEQPALTEANWADLATRIGGIGSDYEKAGLLRAALTKAGQQPKVMGSVLDAVAGVGSDYEKAGVLTSAFQQKLDAAWYPRALAAAATIHSDYEKGRVLKAAAEAPGVPFANLLSAAATMGSDYEKAGVLKRLAALAGSTDAAWTDYFNAVKKIGSDYEKSGVLIRAAAQMPRTEKVLAGYRDAAATINSEYELGRAIKALGTPA